MTEDVQRAIEAVWRIESARLIGGLVRMVRDLSLAEDLAQEALIAALASWSETGIPDNPGAWLMATAKNRALDGIRRQRMQTRRHDEIGRSQVNEHTPDIVATFDEDVGDDVLRLILISCHPVLPREARVALTLRLLGGLSTEEIARAFLISEPTVAQRIVRAKRTLAEARVPFEVPHGEDLLLRLDSVLEVIYLIFNEGYSATRGDDWIRPELCQDAMRLGRVVAERVAQYSEAHGLIALMELQASRFRARVDASGQPVLLTQQDRTRWDRLLIRRGLAALRRAETLAAPLGPYTLQAAIAACHARARTADETDWTRIVALYDALVQVTGSPVVELNRAVAVSMAFGPEAALPLVNALHEAGELERYHLLPSVRGELLSRLERFAEARAEFQRAYDMTANERERTVLQERINTCLEKERVT
ncbi:MAG TPA: RNA polymerase sigma factor [Polyangiales bacterium]|nr:RNA polymerase sigma factor [Polyangiales bacterium]